MNQQEQAGVEELVYALETAKNSILCGMIYRYMGGGRQALFQAAIEHLERTFSCGPYTYGQMSRAADIFKDRAWKRSFQEESTDALA